MFDSGTAEPQHCDCRELGEKEAEYVLGLGVQRGMVRALGEGATAETCGGERAVAGTDVHQEASVAAEVCAEERALDLMRPQR